MNLLLLYPTDFINHHQVMINDHRFDHIINVHRSNKNQSIRIGLINGLIGTGKISNLSNDHIIINVQLNTSPPAALNATVILALPRPIMLKRILQQLSTFGVKNILLINSYRVEKSFWQTPWLQQKKIHQQLILGLEQACDTIMPKVQLIKKFKPFVEDILPTLIQEHQLAILAHPKTDNSCPHQVNKKTIIAIGPEGGFIPFEIDLLEKAGFQTVNLGIRILKVEVAVSTLIAKLFD